jgi:hypothetical protein
MRIIRRSCKRVKAGYALIIVLVFLAVTLLTCASLMSWVSTNAKITGRNNLFNQSEAAAESATENVLATMMRDFNNQTLNSAGTYAALVPDQTNWPIQFRFSDGAGITNRTAVIMDPTSWTPLPQPYTGLYGLGQNCTVSSTATPLNQGESLSATVSQSLWFGTIPVFQYAIFYNPDLEMNPGATMAVNGKVHSNADIWATGNSAAAPLKFSDVVEAAGKVTQTCGPNDPVNTGRSGNVIFLDTTNNPLAGAKSLTLPIGTNNNPIAAEGILNLPPAGLGAPNASAYSIPGQVYPYNEADLIISNAPNGTNLSVYYQDPYNVSTLTRLQPDITNIVTTGSGKSKVTTTNTCFSFATNVSFYDYREYSTVQAVQIDVAKLNVWLTNTGGTGGNQYNVKCGGSDGNHGDKGHWINGIYVYNSIPQTGGSPSTTGQLPAVRVINGQRLPPDGLTVATPQPLYVEGHYNVTTNGVNYSMTLGSSISNTLPAALMGDSITVLSTNWDDGNDIKGKALGTRKSADTTINAATLEGIVSSAKDAGGNKHYSGGVENFLRLLEDWSNNSNGHNGAGVLTYNGSIVVLFTSMYATNFWQQTGNYYNAPNRQWGFDLSFTNQNKLPPMTPQVRAVVRQFWHWTAN